MDGDQPSDRDLDAARLHVRRLFATRKIKDSPGTREEESLYVGEMFGRRPLRHVVAALRDQPQDAIWTEAVNLAQVGA